MDKANESAKPKTDILNRLSRIEGQVKGIKRMIEEEKTCADILTQVAAVRAAINKVGGLILEQYAKECVVKSINSENKEQELESLLNTVQRFLKYVD